jgi:hypothetical protein
MVSLNTAEAAWQVLDGEAVVVDLRTSAYYSLNKTGTYVLARLVGGEKPDAIGATLAQLRQLTRVCRNFRPDPKP